MEILIKLVKGWPLFYDHKHEDFQNREKKIEKWSEIAQIIGSENGEYWQNKWNCLKVNYYKYKKSAENHPNKTYKKYRNWPWAEHMKFFDDFTMSYRKKPKTIRVRQEDEDHLTEAINEESSLDSDDKLTEIIHTIPQKDCPKFKRKRRKMKPFYANKQSEYFKLKNIQNSEFDGVEHLFMSYAQTFKRMPDRLQRVLKLEIITMFARYEALAERHNVPMNFDHLKSAD